MKFLLLLPLFILATVPILQTSIDHPAVIGQASVNSRDLWSFQIFGASIALGLWIRGILRKRVGELALHRHVVTVVAVSVGSYLWLVTPSLLAYTEIKAIARVGPSDKELKADDDFIGRYSSWQCIPPSAWNKDEFEHQLEQLREVLARYYGEVELELTPSSTWDNCDDKDSRQLQRHILSGSTEVIEMIRDSRHFWGPDPYVFNQFSYIRASFYLFMAVAIGIGVLTTVFSYPFYVWRRTFLRR